MTGIMPQNHLTTGDRMFETVLDFWFKEITPKQWWVKDDDFELLISQRFSTLLQQAATS